MQLQTQLTTAAATITDVPFPGGRAVLSAYGTWGSGTLTLTWSPVAGGTYVAIGTGVTLNADGDKGFEMPDGVIQAVLSGSSGATVRWGFGITRPH